MNSAFGIASMLQTLNKHLLFIKQTAHIKNYVTQQFYEETSIQHAEISRENVLSLSKLEMNLEHKIRR